jgi:hypothetical protein
MRLSTFCGLHRDTEQVHIATYRSIRKGYTDLQEQQEAASRELQYKKAGIFVHIQEQLKKLYVVKIPEVAFSSTYRSQELVIVDFKRSCVLSQT